MSKKVITKTYKTIIDGKEVEVKRTFASTEISLLQSLIQYLQNKELENMSK